MDAYKIVKEDIKRTIGLFLQKKMILQPKFTEACCNDYCIQSNRTSHGIDKRSTYANHFNALYNNNEYLCVLSDENSDLGFFQIRYDFRRESISKSRIIQACLIYYPSIEENNELPQKNYIRLEYSTDDDDYTLLAHPRGHIHIGFDNEFRIGVSRIPLFSEFFQAILYLDYNTLWKSQFTNASDMLRIIKNHNQQKNHMILSIEESLSIDEKEHLCVVI